MLKIVIKTSFIALALCCSTCWAEDFGTDSSVVGLGRSGADQLRDYVGKIQKSGELDRRMQAWKKGQIDKIYNPPDLGIKTSYEVKQQAFNPTFVFPQDYVDDKGRVIAKKGTVIEPLKTQSLNFAYIFIDGRDPKQINFALAQAKKYPAKIIFTAGDFVNLGKQYKALFQYDYHGMIIGQMHRLYNIDINSVPAILFQKNTQLFLTQGIGS